LGISVISLLGVIVLSVYLFITPQKLVYVDSAKLVNEYEGMKAARATYQQKASSWKANVDTLTAEVQKQIMAYEKEVSKMSAKEKQLSQELIRTKQRQLMAQQEDQKMTGEVLTQINAYLKKYGKAHGYKIVMAATEYGNIAYADESLDITADVLKGLNEEYQGK
jgi:outer membrane protein